jgi:hypothetical protein
MFKFGELHPFLIGATTAYSTTPATAAAGARGPRRGRRVWSDVEPDAEADSQAEQRVAPVDQEHKDQLHKELKVKKTT